MFNIFSRTGLLTIRLLLTMFTLRVKVIIELVIQIQKAEVDNIKIYFNLYHAYKKPNYN